MEMESFDNPWMRRIRFLTKLLLVSVTLNIGLVTVIVYVSRSGKQEDLKVAKQFVLEKSNGEVLAGYFKASFEELVKELKEKTVLQDGYTNRDLALACLVNYHYLNLEKVISGKPIQRRKLTFIHQEGGESFHVEVFPNLDDLDFSMIEKFVKEEKWPLSFEGLFAELKKQGVLKESSLEQAFLATPEFYLLYTSLKRLDETISKEKIIQFLLEIDFEELERWLSRIKEGGEVLPSMRELFQNSIDKGSSSAAYLWITLDGEYAQRKLPDIQLHKILLLLKENLIATNIFLKQILCSVRSDEVRKQAALKLYEFSGLPVPEPYVHAQALKTFLPNLFSQKEIVKSEKVVKKHLVSDGESLWKIANKHKVSIEALREINHLKTDKLKPGQELILP